MKNLLTVFFIVLFSSSFLLAEDWTVLEQRHSHIKQINKNRGKALAAVYNPNFFKYSYIKIDHNNETFLGAIIFNKATKERFVVKFLPYQHVFVRIMGVPQPKPL